MKKNSGRWVKKETLNFVIRIIIRVKPTGVRFGGIETSTNRIISDFPQNNQLQNWKKNLIGTNSTTSIEKTMF